MNERKKEQQMNLKVISVVKDVHEIWKKRRNDKRVRKKS